MEDKMSTYRLVLNIDDEVTAEDEDLAFDIFIDRIKRGFYGPTRENLEFISSDIDTPLIV